MSKMGDFQELQQIEGLSVSAVSADLYDDGRDDLTLFYFKNGARHAAIYTKSKIVSESINWNLRTKNKFIKGLLVNTQNANTFTGKKGFQDLKELAKLLSKQLTLKLSQSPGGIKDIVGINQIIFASKKCTDYNKIENLFNFLLIEKNSYIFESVEKGKIRGRYTIIGLNPDKIWNINNNLATIVSGSKKVTKKVKPL